MEAEGEAITLVAPEEENDFRGIERTLGRAIPRITLPDFDYRASPPPKTRGDRGPRSGAGFRQGRSGGRRGQDTRGWSRRR